MSESTVIIGAGQAGLAVAHELKERAIECLIIDRGNAVGDTWRHRWDSLRLFTPAAYDALPGLPFPGPRNSSPTKGEVAAYLADYAHRLDVPTRLATAVTRVSTAGGAFRIETSAGAVEATTVVLASGGHPVPSTPGVSADLAGGIRQLHSTDYRRPADLPPGKVLVVGSGTSGVQIALDLAGTHNVTIAGRPTPHIPDAVFRYARVPYWFLVSHLLTLSTPVGRKVAAGFHDRGAPLISVSVDELNRAGVRRVGRVTGADSGRPVVEGGEALDVDTIVWATGYRPDFSWVDGIHVDPHGWPIGTRGVIDNVPGLYTVGLPFQFGLTSALLGGVGRDAAYVADRIAAGRNPASAARSRTAERAHR